MQKMKISGGNSSQEEEGLTILNNNSRVSWSVSSIDGVTEIFYTRASISNFIKSAILIEKIRI